MTSSSKREDRGMSRYKIFYIFLLSFLFPLISYGQNVVIFKAKKRQVPVYKQPDFDSQIIHIFKRNKKFYGIQKILEGHQGLGLFHKVRVNAKTYGYVLDTHVLFADSKNKEVKQDLKTSKNLKDKDSLTPSFSGYKSFKDSRSFLHRSYIGGLIGVADHTLKINGRSEKSLEWTFGFKLSGSQILIPNFLVDITLSAHWGAPQFFNDFYREPSGAFFLAELNFPFPLKYIKSGIFYASIGPAIKASFFNFVHKGKKESHSRVRLGGVLSLGWSYHFGSYVLKAEPKIYIEKDVYWGGLVALQTEF